MCVQNMKAISLIVSEIWSGQDLQIDLDPDKIKGHRTFKSPKGTSTGYQFLGVQNLKAISSTVSEI